MNREREPGKKTWIQVRQEAGPEVKILTYRYHSRRLAKNRAEQRRKEDIRKAIRDCWCRKDPTGRMELYLACVGWNAVHYVLTYEAIAEPLRYQDVIKDIDRFRRALKRKRKRPFVYLYAIEGLHGDKRWHIHLVVDSRETSELEIAAHWLGGHVERAGGQIAKRNGGYRGLAEYLTKERKDGVRKPLDVRGWGVSRELRDRLQPPQKSVVSRPAPRVPKGATQVWRSEPVRNEFGEYRYVTYIKPN